MLKRNLNPGASLEKVNPRTRMASRSEKKPKVSVIEVEPDPENDIGSFNKLVEMPYQEYPPKEQRLFGLTDAPVYYPTEDEFLDPIKYIQSIRHEAEKFGICKIIPPSSWRPGFAIDADKFRFQARANLNYNEKLYFFHKQRGTALRFVSPVLRKAVDLYQLKTEIELRGGEEMVTRDDKWFEVATALGYSSKDGKRQTPSLRLLSERLITPYETYLESYPTPSSPQHPKVCCEKSAIPGEEKESLLICKDCERAYHKSCLDLPAKTNLTSDWFCAPCLASRVQVFGFDVGRRYSLSSFKRRADAFKNKRFPKIGILERVEAENIVEKEFWRLIDSPLESVSVEYGADLHCPEYCSGFPTIGSDPLSKNPWNLSVLPLLPSSLLSRLPSNISGMTVPWVYAGMCLSTFCWHNEDHYTYSINYHHLGDTKTWYGIPGSSAAAFEQAMELEAPELFRKQPDLLFHLSTLLSPADLLKHKVPVYAIDQRAGQFVITFPQAYHAGFNHGFNFNEAVNFCTPDWWPFGRACVERYKKFNWAPVFSHDELLCIASRQTSSPQEALSLLGPVEDMCARESALRKRAKSLVGAITTINVAMAQQCFLCHQYCFLSSFACTCAEAEGRVACLDHLVQLCPCASDCKVLQIHLEDKNISQLIGKLKRLKLRRG
ncbi:hypothetical protein L0F63_005270 [Massospora cicadina]|nr:hypothetical protein L0F63_005270 [Massospora cicadina]